MRKLLLVLAAGAFTLTSCEKEEEPKSYHESKSYTISPSDWEDNSFDMSVKLNWDIIKPELVESAVIEVYGKDGAQYFPLPDIWTGTGFTEVINYSIDYGHIRVYMRNSDYMVSRPTETIEFKVVVSSDKLE